MSSKNFFQKIEKTIDDVIFSVSVSVLVLSFASLGFEAKIEVETSLGLGKNITVSVLVSHESVSITALVCTMTEALIGITAMSYF